MGAQNGGPDVAAPDQKTAATIRGSGLVAARVDRTEEVVADRIGDVEVVTHHQALIVMERVMPSQAIHERQSTDPGVRIHVVGKMQ